MLIVIFILLVSFFIVNAWKTKKSFHMLQQNLYNENNRYLKWIWKNKKQFFNVDVFIIIIAIVGVQWFSKIERIQILFFLMMIGFLVLEWIGLQKNGKKDQNKKKLVYTPRIKRLCVTVCLLYAIPVVLLGMYLENESLCWNLYLLLAIMTYLNPFVVLSAMLINTPMEKMVYFYYKNKAQKKLKSMNYLKIIGITGSYGKTSSKNILSDILNVKYNTLPTPRNLNTYNGLIMTVNNHLDKFTDIFIAEMGAYVKGEIKGLCRLVKPKYGILTTIGTAHLESFGSEENIQKGKFELIESLPKDGFAILNGDDPKQVNYELKNKVKTIWIGIENKDVDIRATNIKCSEKGTHFTLLYEGEKYPFQTKLLGKHNVYNILAGVACGIEFGIPMEDLQQAVSSVRPVEHRLELKPLGNFMMIDDAYNSNPVGAKSALEVLDMMPGVKVVVTPGMIELGEKEKEYNEEFGKQISEVADYVVLIGEKQTKPIQKGLKEKGFDKEKIIVLNDVRDAYPFIEELAMNKEVYALFENDLPDTYNES